MELAKNEKLHVPLYTESHAAVFLNWSRLKSKLVYLEAPDASVKNFRVRANSK